MKTNALIIRNAPANTLILKQTTFSDAVDFGKGDGTAAVYPANRVDTRQGMRKYIKNATPAVENLQQIIDDFIKNVKEAPKEFTYGEIYNYFLDLWFKECERLRGRKLKTVVIDSHYFAIQYAPQI